MADRFKRSGKSTLIILVLSDHDPEGDDIPHSFARSMRYDFGIDKIVTIKVAITQAHVEQFALSPNNLEAKKGGSRYKQFTKKYGNYGYELEAIPSPADLQLLLRQEIIRVMDVKAFNAEIDTEKHDAAHLDTVRRSVQALLASLDFGDGQLQIRP
jgi:hypothetical protein